MFLPPGKCSHRKDQRRGTVPLHCSQYRTALITANQLVHGDTPWIWTGLQWVRCKIMLPQAQRISWDKDASTPHENAAIYTVTKTVRSSKSKIHALKHILRCWSIWHSSVLQLTVHWSLLSIAWGLSEVKLWDLNNALDHTASTSRAFKESWEDRAALMQGQTYSVTG